MLFGSALRALVVSLAMAQARPFLVGLAVFIGFMPFCAAAPFIGELPRLPSSGEPLLAELVNIVFLLFILVS